MEHEAAQEEACALLIDEKKWDDAIATCGAIDTDYAKHLTANAYMGRAGLDMITVAGGLSGANDTTAAIFSYLPDSSTDAVFSDYNSALNILMGSMTSRDLVASLEATIISTFLIFTHFKEELDLTTDATGDTVLGCLPASCPAAPYTTLRARIGADQATDQVNVGGLLDYNGTAATEVGASLADFSNFNILNQMDNGDSTATADDATIDSLEITYYLQNALF